MALLLAATLVGAGCGAPTAAPRRQKACRTAPGPPPSQCRLLGSEADWLPPAYVRNAACRCTATPNSPTANCVRGKVDAALDAVTEETREAWRRKKRELHDAGRHEAYEQWVRETAGPEIYRWHAKAHRRCCCAAPVPPYEQWSAAVTEPLASCSEARAVARFGSCRGHPDAW